MTKTLIKRKRKKPLKGNDKPINPELFTSRTYFCMKDMMSKRATSNMLEQYADMLVQWVKRDTSFSIEQFCGDLGVNLNTYNYWLKRSPMLKEAHEYALMVIGVRRENGALNNDLHAGMVLSSLPSFLERWREVIRFKERAKVEAQNEQAASEFDKTIVIERFPNDPRVPTKKEPE